MSVQSGSDVKTYILKPPKGMDDHDPKEMIKRDWVLRTIESVFKKHSIGKLDTPVMERREILYAKASEETTKQIYDIVDRAEIASDNVGSNNSKDLERERLSMRFDLTVSLARYIAQNNITSFSRYQYGKVYRGENISRTKGRFREFLQFDFDIIGGEMQEFADVRTIMILAEIFEALALTDGFSVILNHRVILRAIMAACGVPANLQMTCCSSIDKLDKTPWEDVKKEMITKGVSAESVEKMHFLDKYSKGEKLTEEAETKKEEPTTTTTTSSSSSSFSSSSSSSSSSVSASTSTMLRMNNNYLSTLEGVEKFLLESDFYKEEAKKEKEGKKEEETEKKEGENNKEENNNNNENNNNDASTSSSSSSSSSTATSTATTVASSSSSISSPSLSDINQAFSLLRMIYSILSSSGLPPCLCYNPSLARGHDYYTGLIFEGCFYNDTTGETCGTCVGGGRYDNLIGLLSASRLKVPAIGFGLGFERLVSLVTDKRLRRAGVTEAVREADVLISPIGFDKSTISSSPVISALFHAERVLTQNGLRCEIWKSKNCNAKIVIPECNRMGIPVLLQIGENELKEGSVFVKKVEEKRKLKPGQKQVKNKEEKESNKKKSGTFKLDDPALIAQIKEWIIEADEDLMNREKEKIEKEKKEDKEREIERREQAKRKGKSKDENKVERNESSSKENENIN